MSIRKEPAKKESVEKKPTWKQRCLEAEQERYEHWCKLKRAEQELKSLQEAHAKVCRSLSYWRAFITQIVESGAAGPDRWRRGSP
jgi:hypothetical protein